MRKFTNAMLKSDPLALNAGGSCGCGGPQVCTPVPPNYPPSYPPGSYQPPGVNNQPGTYQTPQGTPPVGDPSIVPIMLPGPQQMPQNLDPAAWDAYQRATGQMCIPYKDAIRDCLLMTMMATAPTAVGIGATVNVDYSPTIGWADIYYIDVVAWLTGGIDAGPDAFNMVRPIVLGCPTPVCDSGQPINRHFYDVANGGCCCGKPFRAIVQQTSVAQPLRAVVTNLNAAAITVQILYRGFCNGSRICA